MPANGCSTNETNCFPFPHNRRNGETVQYKPIHVSEGSAPQASGGAPFKTRQWARRGPQQTAYANSHNRSFSLGSAHSDSSMRHVPPTFSKSTVKNSS